MPQSPSRTRDAALKRMRRINRWLLTGAIVVTGALTDAVAQAFPGRTITRGVVASTAHSSSNSAASPTPGRPTSHHHAHARLKPPHDSPQAKTTVATPTTTQTPAAQPAPVAPAPVVSGAS
jgi:hypothetical protein